MISQPQNDLMLSDVTVDLTTAGSNQIKGDLEANLNFNSPYYFLKQYGRIDCC